MTAGWRNGFVHNTGSKFRILFAKFIHSESSGDATFSYLSALKECRAQGRCEETSRAPRLITGHSFSVLCGMKRVSLDLGNFASHHSAPVKHYVSRNRAFVLPVLTFTLSPALTF